MAGACLHILRLATRRQTLFRIRLIEVFTCDLTVGNRFFNGGLPQISLSVSRLEQLEMWRQQGNLDLKAKEGGG